MKASLRILIVEDEPLAAAQLSALILKLRPNSLVLSVCDTIESTVRWIENNPAPDLAFFDIQLGDGLSFEIFAQTDFDAPVIFATAYDQYAIQAFKVNSVDYILKPINDDELLLAIEKFEKNSVKRLAIPLADSSFRQLIESLSKPDYKKRFLIKIGTQLKSVDIDEVLYFYSYQKGSYIKTIDNKNYLLDQTLELTEQQVDPKRFFRINRKYLISINAIVKVCAYSNSRLKLIVTHPNDDDDDDDFLVAREKVKQFKTWLDS